MSGSTGKMTAAAVRERGPQMVLRNVYKDRRFIGQVIASEDWTERGQWWSSETITAAEYSTPAVAKSYSLSYLTRVAKGNRQ